MFGNSWDIGVDGRVAEEFDQREDIDVLSNLLGN